MLTYKRGTDGHYEFYKDGVFIESCDANEFSIIYYTLRLLNGEEVKDE